MGNDSDLKALDRAAGASNKLLGLVARQIVSIFRDPNLPRELKLLLVPLFFMVPLYSLVILIFVGNVTYCIARNEEMRFVIYLIFLGVTTPLVLGMLLIYNLLSDKYVSTHDLNDQLQTVTIKRGSRRRVPVGRDD